MLNQGARALSVFFALSLVAVACGDDDDDGDPTATGGSGGKTNGGATFGGGAGKGGGATTGGANNGGSSTGGKSTGGGPSTGGATTTGGTGQAGEGGALTGGTAGEGGTIGEGGGGAGGTTTGGVGPEGGSSGAGTGGTGGTGEGGSVSGGAGGFGGGDDVGGAGAGGGPPVNLLVNGSFESSLTGWTVAGTVSVATVASSAAAHDQTYYLNLWSATAYDTTVSQVVSLPPGNYTLSVWHQSAQYISQNVYVKGHDAANAATTLSVAAPWWQTPWHQLTIDIPVTVAGASTSAQVEVGIVSVGAAEAWSQFDHITLTAN